MAVASYGRANEWSGIQAGPLHPVRMAVVSSTTAWHVGGSAVLVADPGPQAELTATEVAVRTALAAAGARPRAVSLSIVDTIPAGAAGKRPLVMADKAATPRV